MSISAAQCKANPADAANYIKSMEVENERLREELRRITALSAGEVDAEYAFSQAQNIAVTALCNQQGRNTEKSNG